MKRPRLLSLGRREKIRKGSRFGGWVNMEKYGGGEGKSLFKFSRISQVVSEKIANYPVYATQ